METKLTDKFFIKSDEIKKFKKDVATLSGHSSWVNSVAFSPDGKILASGSDDYRVKLWDIESKSEIANLSGHNSYVRSVAFSSDGKYLASGSNDYKVKLWDIESKSEIKTLSGHSNYVYSVAFSPDGKILAFGSGDKIIKLWDIESKSEIATLSGHNDYVYSVAFSPDGKYLASGSGDKIIKLWDIESKKEIATLSGHEKGIRGLAFSPDGKILASGSLDGSVRIWDIEKGEEVKKFYEHTGEIYSVAFSPCGRYLASSGQNGEIKIYDLCDFFEVLTPSDVYKVLLNEDKVRADIMPYNKKMLEDIKQGHWSLWDRNKEDFKEIKLSKKLVAKNPKSSIVNGVVAIDFGTKSTVVVYQKDSSLTLPMRIGVGDWSKPIEAYHYENPTVMEFNDLVSFLNDYKSRDKRPFTKWKDLVISHTAFNNLLDNKSEYFNSYINNLKQWAGAKTENKKLKIEDKKKNVFDIPEYLSLKEDDLDPIELYAYYIGLYINNMHNGIYLNYILSFPVTYEMEVREKILESFKKGLKKSLPKELDEKIANNIEVIQGASEPAAYAAIALSEYEFDPEDDERVFYGVFDFGGGTTDFDFGIFREANGKKERRYDYTIEHFGAGGDRYLGGENLLELLAFEIFKKNKDKLLEENIQFVKPEEVKEFLGSENLLSSSREAEMNTARLKETLRGFWEGKEELDEGEISVNLFDINGELKPNFSLDIDSEELENILRSRIKRGVDNFFNALRKTLSNDKFDFNDIEEINIFLAGNSSKSEILKELFDEKIKEETEKFKKNKNIDNQDIFKLFPPLSNDDDFEKPNGKTGVAFGLIETRKGANIYIIDHNIEETNSEIHFKYYLGRNKKKKFKVVIDRETSYNEWIPFIDASVDTFEIYYSSQSIVTTNKISITDESIKKLILKIDKTDDEADIYIRLISPNEFEYAVAKDIKKERFLTDIKKVSI